MSSPRILALDLGTSTGFAYNTGDWDGSIIVAGTRKLATAKEIGEWHRTRMNRRCDPRPGRLFDFIKDLWKTHLFNVIVFEDVEFQTYTQQCQLWASFRAAVWIFSEANAITIDCVPVGTLKKFATGHGGATKEMMYKALLRQPGGGKFLAENPLDDNGVDALHLHRWATVNLGRLK